MFIGRWIDAFLDGLVAGAKFCRSVPALFRPGRFKIARVDKLETHRGPWVAWEEAKGLTPNDHTGAWLVPPQFWCQPLPLGGRVETRFASNDKGHCTGLWSRAVHTPKAVFVDSFKGPTLVAGPTCPPNPWPLPPPMVSRRCDCDQGVEEEDHEKHASDCVFQEPYMPGVAGATTSDQSRILRAADTLAHFKTQWVSMFDRLPTDDECDDYETNRRETRGRREPSHPTPPTDPDRDPGTQ